MKYYRIMYLQLCLMLLFLCGLYSCGREATVKIPIDGQFCVMRSDTADSVEVDAAIRLVGGMEQAIGRKLSLATDWVKRGEPIPEATYEILVGMTNRSESFAIADKITSESLRNRDFYIAYQNNRIVLLGVTPEATLAAVDYFIANCIDAATDSFILPEDPLLVEGSYPIAQLLLDGKSIGDYTVFAEADNPTATSLAAALTETLYRQTGYSLAISDSNCRIYIGMDKSVGDGGLIRRTAQGVELVGGSNEYLSRMANQFLTELNGGTTKMSISLDQDIMYSSPNGGFRAGSQPKTQEEYEQRMDRLSSLSSDVADTEIQNEIAALTDGLRQLILSNTDNVSVTGKTYYVSPDGDDSADGLSEKSAWKTLEHVNAFKFAAGDAVLFKRGGLWRGFLKGQNGITFSAYGDGEKPRIYAAYDGLTVGKWVQTDIKNVWRLDTAFTDIDIGLLVMNEDNYAVKVSSIDALQKQGDFYYNSEWCSPKDFDNKVYLYSEKNPSEIYRQIDVSMKTSVIPLSGNAHDVTFRNLDLRYGQDHFFGSNFKNITVCYCTFSWQGGQYISADNLKGYGGGGGAWQNATNLVYDHCLFYQQFDCCVTLQFKAAEGSKCVYDGYTLTNCLLDSCEYGFEYFLSVPETYENHYENLYIAHNIFRNGGDSHFFGTKHEASSYLKGWSTVCHNRSENSLIEKNLFDRPYARAVSMFARDRNMEYSIDDIFDMKSNVYYCRRGQVFATVNGVDYTFDEDSLEALQENGFEDGAVFLYRND